MILLLGHLFGFYPGQQAIFWGLTKQPAYALSVHSSRTAMVSSASLISTAAMLGAVHHLDELVLIASGRSHDQLNDYADESRWGII